MSTHSRSSFNMGRSFLLIGTDVIFAFVSMMMVIRWRNEYLNSDLEGFIDHKAAYIAAATTLINWVLLRQDRAIWRFICSIAPFIFRVPRQCFLPRCFLG